MDLSLGMLRAVDPRIARRLVGDACALPVLDGAADVALAMNVLYHVADIPRTVLELHRVKRPDGVALVSASSRENFAELLDVWSWALSEAAGTTVVLERDSSVRFTVEDGADVLGRVFASVELKPFRATLRVPDARVVRDYADSGRTLYDHLLPDTSLWTVAMDLLERRVAGQIERDGEFAVTTSRGIFVCR